MAEDVSRAEKEIRPSPEKPLAELVKESVRIEFTDPADKKRKVVEYKGFQADCFYYGGKEFRQKLGEKFAGEERLKATVEHLYFSLPDETQEAIFARAKEILKENDIALTDSKVSLFKFFQIKGPELIAEVTREKTEAERKPELSESDKTRLQEFEILDRSARDAGIKQGVFGVLSQLKHTQKLLVAVREASAEEIEKEIQETKRKVAEVTQRAEVKYRNLVFRLTELGVIPLWLVEKENLAVAEEFPPEFFWRDSDFDWKEGRLRLNGREYELLPVEQRGHLRTVFDADESVIKVDRLRGINVKVACWKEITTFVKHPWLRKWLLPIERWGIVRAADGPHVFVVMPKVTKFYKEKGIGWVGWNEHPEVHALMGIISDLGGDNVGKYEGRWVLVDYGMAEPAIDEGESYGELLEQYDRAVKKGGTQYKKSLESGELKNWDEYERIKREEVGPLQERLREKIEKAKKRNESSKQKQ